MPLICLYRKRRRLPATMSTVEVVFSTDYTVTSRGLSFRGHSNGSSAYRFTLTRSFLKEGCLSVSLYESNLFTNVGRDCRIYGVTVSLHLGKLLAKVKRTMESIWNDDVIQDGNLTETIAVI